MTKSYYYHVYSLLTPCTRISYCHTQQCAFAIIWQKVHHRDYIFIIYACMLRMHTMVHRKSVFYARERRSTLNSPVVVCDVSLHWMHSFFQSILLLLVQINHLFHPYYYQKGDQSVHVLLEQETVYLL